LNAKPNSKIIYKPLSEDDPKRDQPNISLAKNKLIWEPKVELNIGLKRTIKYFTRKLKSIIERL
tara:strand:+ start:714 stop:905 length:192 start_codon:yes stop_codon:yes gene_type:complete